MSDVNAVQAATAIRQEDLLETLSAHPATAALQAAGFDWGQIIQVLGPYIFTLIQQVVNRPKPAPAPVPVPIPSAPPEAPPAPTAHVPRIVGGHGKVTGITEGGPTGPRVDAVRLAGILAGTLNAPHDSRFEIDVTPMFEDGSFAGADDPRWAGQPNAPKGAADTEAPSQPVRLEFDYDGDGSADLAHEYANYGCNARIRVKTPVDSGGTLSNLRARYAASDGSAAYIAVAVGPIHVGRGA